MASEKLMKVFKLLMNEIRQLEARVDELSEELSQTQEILMKYIKEGKE